MRSRRTVRRGMGVVVAAFLLLAVFLGALVFRKYENAGTPPPVPAAPQQAGQIAVTLFFADENGDGLMREGREIGGCDEMSGCLESILEELINGPVGDLAPVLPVTGMFNSVRLDGTLARVDFAQELLDALPAGSSSELLAAYAVVNSLALNYPQVQSVLFTVDGKPLETLKGHLDVRQPLVPDFSLEKGAAIKQSQQSKGTKE
ncbi:MAG TPA: GerMN domain-containing protein [Geobacteraceae bacterium]|nr:GerMN domain-containing protein [Geobacteraceae bacterium]